MFYVKSMAFYPKQNLDKNKKKPPHHHQAARGLNIKTEKIAY